MDSTCKTTTAESPRKSTHENHLRKLRLFDGECAISRTHRHCVTRLEPGALEAHRVHLPIKHLGGASSLGEQRLLLDRAELLQGFKKKKKMVPQGEETEIENSG